MNLDGITAKVKQLSRETVAEVQKLNEVRGLNSQINAEKKQISEIYAEMGRKLYDCYKEEPLEGFETEFHSLDQSFGAIEELQRLVRAAKGVTICPNCKMEVGVMERFCSNCGCKMPEEYRIEAEETVVPEVEAQEASEAAGEDPEAEKSDPGVPENETGEAEKGDPGVPENETGETEKSDPAMPETGMGEAKKNDPAVTENETAEESTGEGEPEAAENKMADSAASGGETDF